MLNRRWMSWLMTVVLLACLSPAMGQEAEIAWDVNYQPGTDQGRQGLPTDAATTPRWRIISFAEPSKTTLASDHLVIATGDDEKPVTGAAAYQINFDKPAEAFTLTFEVASEHRSEYFAGGVLLGSGAKFTAVQLGGGHVLMAPAAGGWTRGDYTKFTTFWVTLHKQGDAWVLRLYQEGKADPLQVNESFFGPIDYVRIGDYSTGVGTNGTTKWRSIRWKSGQAITPPWVTAAAKAAAAAGGAPDAVSIKGGPVQVLNAQNARDVSINRLVDTEQGMTFIVDSKGPIQLAVAPRKLAITKGQHYWVNTTQYPPFVTQAEQDGVLVLKLGSAAVPVVNCQIRIEPTDGRNLVVNGSFETADASQANQPQGWRYRISQEMKPTLEYGHELIDSSSNASDTAPRTNAEVVLTEGGRTGSHALRMGKPHIQGEIILEQAQAMDIQPGVTYLVQGHYQLPDYRLGAAAHFLIEVTGPGKAPQYFRDSLINPLVSPSQGQWRRSFFTFKAPEGYNQARLRLSLRGSPATIVWDDITMHVAPTAIAQLPVQTNELQSAYTLGEDELVWRMKQREPLKAELERVNGSSVVVKINDKPVGSLGFVPGPSSYPAYGTHRQMGEAGVPIHWVPIYAGDTQNKRYGEPLWIDDDTFDFTYLEKQLTHALRRNIDTRIMLYLNLDPPRGFVERHPEAAWINFNGDRTIGHKGAWRVFDQLKEGETINFSYTAPAYREVGSRFMEAMGKFLAQSPVGKAVIGVHITGGNDGQFFHIHGPAHADRSEGALVSYRQWLRERYNNDQAALRKAWGDDKVTFDTVQFPAEKERSPESLYLRLNVPEERRVMDWNLFVVQGNVDTLDLFGQAYKRGVGRPSLVITYYNDVIHGQDLTKEALARLLNSKGIDGSVSVIPYGLTREQGRYGAINALVSSYNLHGKLHLAELDYRSNWSWLPADAWNFRASWGVPQTAEGWAHQYRRDLGHALTLGQGAWLYGLGGNTWLTDDYMLAVREGARVAQLQAEQPVKHEVGQVAVFADENSLPFSTRRNIFGAATAVTNHAAMRAVLSHSGLSWDRYLLSDLTHPNLPDYRMMIFLSSQSISDEQIKAIESRFQKDGRVLVFLHGVGLSQPQGFEASVKRLTGITAKADLSDLGVRRYVPTSAGAKAVSGVEELFTETRSPLFWVEDSSAQALATLTGTQGKVGLALKRGNGWTGVYSALPGGLSVPLLRYLAQQADITPIGPAQDVTYAGRGLIVFHAIRDGEKTLQWKDKKDVLDLTTGQIVARGATSLTFTIQTGQTRWFRLQDHF